jgi:hypothetical protein
MKTKPKPKDLPRRKRANLADVRRRRRRRIREPLPRFEVDPDRTWHLARAHPRWARRVVDQLGEAGIPAFQARDEVEVTRQQRRRVQRLSDQVDKLLDTDRRFFERLPWRSHRIRLASQAEIEARTVLTGLPPAPPAGASYYVGVRQVQPGFRIRIFFASTAGNDVDVSEEEARWVYERFSGGRFSDGPFAVGDDAGRR